MFIRFLYIIINDGSHHAISYFFDNKLFILRSLLSVCQISNIWEILVCEWEEKAFWGVNMWEWSVVGGRGNSSQYCWLRDWTDKTKSTMRNRNLPYVRICRIRNMRMIMSIMFLKDFKMDKTFLCSSSQKNRENSHSKGRRYKIGWFKKFDVVLPMGVNLWTFL